MKMYFFLEDGEGNDELHAVSYFISLVRAMAVSSMKELWSNVFISEEAVFYSSCS